MINKNLNLKRDCIVDKDNISLKEPFLLKPVGKDYLWGGNRLNDEFNKEMELKPLAESWECSTHQDGESMVGSGVFKGESLRKVLKMHPELLGLHSNGSGELPILIKLIDAKKNLSVQVHPDDEYAHQYENGSFGKTEMWYILGASEDSKIIYGFNNQIDRETLRKSIESGEIEKYLQKVKVKKDDVFLIEAGTVHAIGEGVIIAEIQQNSNLTYRLYDYNRVDKNGKRRELHIEKALDVINFSIDKKPRQPMRILRYKKGCATELLCRCKYFQTERQLINTEKQREMFHFQSKSDSFEVLLCVEGCGILFIGEKEHLNIFKGDCIFVPADSIELKLHGKMQLLKVSC